MKKIKFTAITLVLLAFLASISLFISIENYSRSDLGKSNAKVIAEFYRTGDANKCDEIEKYPAGIESYDNLFSAIFIVIVTSAIAIIAMYLSEAIKMDKRDKLIFAMALILMLLVPFSFIFYSSFTAAVAIASALLFLMLKISLFDKLIFIISPYAVFFSYWILIGSWFKIETLLRCLVA